MLRHALSVSDGLMGGVECLDKTLTQLHQQEESDINVIVKRFGVTGMLPQNVHVPLNVDFDSVFDYRSAMDVLRAADEAFMRMPADVRMRFNNNAALFVDFASDPDNVAEMRKLGLAVPVEVVVEPPVAAVPPVK